MTESESRALEWACDPKMLRDKLGEFSGEQWGRVCVLMSGLLAKVDDGVPKDVHAAACDLYDEIVSRFLEPMAQAEIDAENRRIEESMAEDEIAGRHWLKVA